MKATVASSTRVIRSPASILAFKNEAWASCAVGPVPLIPQGQAWQKPSLKDSPMGQ